MRVDWTRRGGRTQARLYFSPNELKLIAEPGLIAAEARALLEREKVAVPPELRELLERVEIDCRALASAIGHDLGEYEL